MSEIKLSQKPVITHDLVKVGKSVTERLKELNIDGQVATLETVQALKKLRATLNKERAEYDVQVKAVEGIVLAPIKELKSDYKVNVSDKYDNADKTLKDKIAIVEDEVKLNKKKAVESYFKELCLSEKIDFVSFEKVGIEINLSTTEKAYKEKCADFISKIVDDLSLIDTQEFKAEILVEYKKTLNASKSIKEIQDRKEAERQETERIKIQESARRKKQLESIGMVYVEMVKLFEYKESSEIYITLDNVDNLSNEEFSNSVIRIQESIRAIPIIIITQESTSKEVVSSVMGSSSPLQSSNVINQNHIIPSSPYVGVPIEKSPDKVTASFECTGTVEQLKSVGNFMKQNNITYKNI